MDEAEGRPGPSDPHTAAKAYASLGWRVVPIAPGQKRPTLPNWSQVASDDLAVIDSWWTGLYRGHGVGVATGPGTGIWVLDVDVAGDKPGADSLADLIATHGPLPRTVTAVTGTGGLHFLFAWDPHHPVTNGDATRLGPGLDIRGAGGQIVVAPTTHPNGHPYRWETGRDPWTLEVAPAPDWLYELLHRQLLVTPAPAGAGVPLAALTGTSSSDDSIADWVNTTRDWHTELQRHGWQGPKQYGNDTAWTRPGKDPRAGHSAVLHEPDGPLVVFTTEIPSQLTVAGSPTRDRGAVSLSLFGFIAGMEAGGDRSALARSARAERNRIEATPSTPRPPVDDGDQNLPASFWEARPALAQIHAAAWSRLLSPDAVLAAVLARLAALVPPSLKLPAIIGAHASVSFYAVLTGPPGTGKSTAIATAADLLPIEGQFVIEGGQVGSGEGLIELYMTLKEEDDGKGRTKYVKRKTRNGAFVTLDEGAALAEMGQRKGSTLLPILRSMWTGGQVGQANASAETKRQLPAGTYTLGFLLGIQPSRAAEFLADDAAGTPQRFIWARSTDPTIPTEPVEWPGRLWWSPPQHGTAGVELTDAIVTEIRSNALARNRGELIIDPLDAHGDLLRLKCAALLAILDERPDVTDDDWDLAGVVVETSARVRGHVVATVAFENAERERARTGAVIGRERALAEDRDAREVEKYEQTLDSAARTVYAVVSKGGDEGVPRREITIGIGGRRRRIVSVDDVLDRALSLQWIEQISNGRFVPGKAAPRDTANG